MMVRLVLIPLLLAAAPELAGQSNRLVADARVAYENLDFARTIALATRATGEKLGPAELEAAWTLLGFAYASIDSARLARDAFKQVTFLNPDWVLDESRISPKITSLQALALREVLVVRQPRVDSADFVIGSGAVGIRFIVTRTARVELRLVSRAGPVVLDTVRGDGLLSLRWDGRLPDGSVPAAGRYTVVLEAAAGRDSYARSIEVEIGRIGVDTLPHLTSLPGYELLPERIVPPRSWKPLGITLITSAIAGGGALALESGELGSGPRRELAAVSLASIGVGLFAMLRKPAAVPSEANIRYNRIVADNLSRENTRLAQENESRRRQVRLTVRPISASEGHR